MQIQKSDLIERELKLTMEQEITDKDLNDIGKLSPFTCPECHGLL